MNVQISSNFKKMTGKSIFAIILFIVIYVVLLLLAIALTVLCVLGAFAFVSIKPMMITYGVGIAFASIGFLTLIFLFKFTFKKHKVDRSHLVEITVNDEPKLFSFIRDIVEEVQTDFPKRVYLSNDVNASVFYDSSFWSMVFPIRKNLQIGLGLVNTISEQEFKAILAHEFGHFSQRSMKVGSYVYNVNKVIFNMLYDNESYDNMIEKWQSINSYFSLFVSIATGITLGIQWILKKMYDFINISYMALSREMEFHADEIAANVAGYLPLKESLLRMDLAEHSYNIVLGYYEGKISDNIKSKNIYEEQEFIMNFLAEQNNLTFRNNLPIVSEVDLNKYNKSRLIIKNQWASHPNIEERIKALELTNIHKQGVEKPAMLLFGNHKKIQEEMTEKLFSFVTYSDHTKSLEFEEFKSDYLHTLKKNQFPKVYNCYYDNKNPIKFDVDGIVDFKVSETLDQLFSKEKVDLIYDDIALENDKTILEGIANKQYEIKSFDYDGQKYQSYESWVLIPTLEKEQSGIKEQIIQNDLNIYKFFYNEALKKGNAQILKEKYINFFKIDAAFDNKVELSKKIGWAINFMTVKTPYDEIKVNLKDLLPFEVELKNEIKKLIEDETLTGEISEATKENLEKYLLNELEYFNGQEYNNDNVQILFNAVKNYNYLFPRQYFISKLDLLNYQIKQLEN